MSDSFEPMDCSTPGFPVLHHFPKLAETCVLWVGDAIQPSHPPSSPSRAFSLSQHQIFSNESALHISWPNYWSFSIIISPSNEYSGLISFKINWFDLLSVQGTLSPVLLSISSSVFLFSHCLVLQLCLVLLYTFSLLNFSPSPIHLLSSVSIFMVILYQIRLLISI